MADDVVNNEITQGQLGQINGSDVGVAWVAPDGSEARIMIAATGGGTRWELLCDVRPNDVVPLGAGLVLGPVFFIAAPGFDLLLSGLVGGTIAYLVGARSRDASR